MMQKKNMQKPRRRRRSPVPILLLIAVLMAASYGAGWFMGQNSMTGGSDVLLVNASHRLDKDYVPEGLVNLYQQRHSFRLANAEIYVTRETYEAMEKMFHAAEEEGVNGFIITSGYRDYNRQAEVFAESEAGKAQEPGASEHQTGLAFDVTAENSGAGFESTQQYLWLCANAADYGFIQRYPPNKSSVTGISYEPWHYRFVGVKNAKKIAKRGVTLEEYLG